MKNNLIIFIKAWLAGICITIGCNVYIACDNKYIGAFLFSIGLITILLFDLNLYTGKVGYAIYNNITYLKDLVIILLGNVIGCICVGVMFPSEGVQILCETKLQESFTTILFKSIMCGCLMYIAVDTYKTYHTLLPTILCIPTFILSGYEHSIADIAYFMISRTITLQSFLFIIIVIIGNAVGGLLIPVCVKLINQLNNTK